jgi:hypothetical protein
MNRCTRITVLALVAAAAVAALAAAPAAAQGYDGHRFELTPHVGYRWGGEITGDDNVLFETDLEVNDGEAFGLTFDIPLSSNFQLELLAQRQDTELGFDEGLFGGSFDVADITVDYYHVGFVAQTTDNDVVPFFVISAGVTRLDPDVPEADTEERFSMGLGGGVKIFFSEHVGMRFEGRGFFTVIDDYDSGCFDDDDCCGCDDYYDDGTYLTQGQASAGLIFAW